MESEIKVLINPNRGIRTIKLYSWVKSRLGSVSMVSWSDTLNIIPHKQIPTHLIPSLRQISDAGKKDEVADRNSGA